MVYLIVEKVLQIKINIQFIIVLMTLMKVSIQIL